MKGRRYDQHEIIDLGGVWHHMKSLGPEGMHHLGAVYQQLGRPLGDRPWAFGLWVTFETWTTNN